MEYGLLGAGNNAENPRSAPPQALTITKGASNWTEVVVANYGVLAPAPGTYDGSNVFFRNARDPGNAIANLEYAQGRAGVCILAGRGSWWVNVQTNIAAGTFSMVLYDLVDAAALFPFAQALSSANGAARTMSAPNNVTIGAASAQIIASNANRNFLALTHSGTTDGSTATTSTLDIAFGTTALINKGIRMYPKQTIFLDSLDGICLQTINGISSSGNILVEFQEGI